MHRAAEFVAVYAPALIANGSATLIAKGTPIDKGARFVDGRRLLGDGKTWEGFSLAILYSLSVTLLEAQLLQNTHILFLGLLASLGALLGDMLGSFLKRRLGLERGAPLPILDQLDFILGAYALTLIAGYKPPVLYMLALAALVYALHRATNYVAYRIGVKPVPW